MVQEGSAVDNAGEEVSAAEQLQEKQNELTRVKGELAKAQNHLLQERVSKAEMENRMVEAEAQARAALQACDKLQDLLKRSRERTVNAEVERDLCRNKLTIQRKEAAVKLSALAFDLNTLRDNVNEDFTTIAERVNNAADMHNE